MPPTTSAHAEVLRALDEIIAGLDLERLSFGDLLEAVHSHRQKTKLLKVPAPEVVIHLWTPFVRARTRKALAQRKAAGRPAGSAPFGYEVDEGELVSNAREQRILKIIADNPMLSLRKLVVLLAERKLTGRTGQVLGTTQIHRLRQRLKKAAKAAKAAAAKEARGGKTSTPAAPKKRAAAAEKPAAKKAPAKKTSKAEEEESWRL